MKATVLDISGKKKADIELPAVFESQIREDIIEKYVEADKYWQPYGNYPEAGRRHSASGIISHKRHDWKGQYGKGISRVPRKIIWRRGVQFNWVGAEVSGTRGGRRTHGPKAYISTKKINKKEMKIAMNGGIASTAQENYIKERYSSLKNVTFKVPLVVELKNNIKSKEFFALIRSTLGEASSLALKHKEVRAGKGKARGRKYKSNAGLLLVTGKDEKVSMKGVTVRPYSRLKIADLWPLGRLTMYTEKALQEMKQ